MSGEDSVLTWPKAPRFEKAALIGRLQALLAGRVREAYLFGSYARGEATDESDVDLMVVAPTHLPWPERHRDFADVQRELGAVDLLVYSPDEWQDMTERGNDFIESARPDWVRLV